MLPLLLEATRLALHEGNNNERPTRDFIYTGLYLGICIAFRLTNVVMAAPIVILFGIRLLRRPEGPAFRVLTRALLAGLVALLPLVPHTLYIYRETLSPVFPLYNKFFVSPFWPEMNVADGRWGPEGGLQMIGLASDDVIEAHAPGGDTCLLRTSHTRFHNGLTLPRAATD
ncbi:MAG: hypothetical protein ACR2HX_17460 [Pyrinomonadaceae bacterium]